MHAPVLIRDISALDGERFDVVVVGGGINGAYCALDAVSRGLRVALVESHDFTCATSANSSRVAHSGLRYLQHGHLSRLRQSARERALLLANAPHLVRNVPVLFPTRGHGAHGPEIMRFATGIFDLLSADLRRSADPDRRIAASRLIAVDEARAICPLASWPSMNGAVEWPETVIDGAERLVIAILRAAAGRGLVTANACSARRLTATSATVAGVELEDTTNGRSHCVLASSVIDASGPWLGDLSAGETGPEPGLALCLVTRSLCSSHILSFSVPAVYADKDALIARGETMQFAVPWRGKSIIGTLHVPWEAGDEGRVSQSLVDRYLAMINTALPEARLDTSDVERVWWGRLPVDEAGSAAPSKEAKVLDYGSRGGLAGHFGVRGVKFTTARSLAQETVDRVCQYLGHGSPCHTRDIPVWGGDIANLGAFMAAGERAVSYLPAMCRERLLRTYGTGFRNVLRYVQSRPELIEGTAILQAEIVHAVAEEAAQSLGDVVFRRTDLASAGNIEAVSIEAAADVMGALHGWERDRIVREIDAVHAVLDPISRGAAYPIRTVAGAIQPGV